MKQMVIFAGSGLFLTTLTRLEFLMERLPFRPYLRPYPEPGYPLVFLLCYPDCLPVSICTILEPHVHEQS